ncbi:hypothetical protein EKO27_g9912 [Xylaria grammica]|uniref:Uncharacterized protein n=1 Tax=Xylaria grammica TaxID=363999 RepID=A0A439CSN6_9PEZI|nr:hypothetical protein EKO27_g9912 [Xylaria grammica]
MTASGSQSEAVSKATQTEDDWDEAKVDVKQLVKALRSLAPQTEAAEPGRKFNGNARPWLDHLRPTPERLQTSADMLVSMFIRDKDGCFLVSGVPVSSPTMQPSLPTFCDKLALRLSLGSATRDVSPGFFPDEQVAQIRQYITQRRAKANAIDEDVSRQDVFQVDENSARWKWASPLYRHFTLYYVRGSIGQAKCVVEEYGETETPGPGSRLATDGYDADHYIELLNWIMYFLGVFAGSWPSRSERLNFSHFLHLEPKSYRRYIQIHFRYFTTTEPPVASPGTNGGLLCHREQGRIASDALGVAPHSFTERRISVSGLLSLSTNIPAFYSVLIVGETEFRAVPYDYDIEWCAGLEGTITFKIALLASVKVWETEWNKVLDRVDDCLRVHLGQTLNPKEMDKWMFDDNFERSRLYFTVLQILRIFGDCIRTVSDDLRDLDGLFLGDPDFPMRHMRQGELHALRSNWESVRDAHRKAEQGLLGRILYKTEEVKSLRDGLFNATSLREANRSTVMGRYVLIFTVVTILYLPPSFISAVLDMEIFQKDVAQTKWEYKVSVVSVSLLTYLVAFTSIVVVDWEGFKHKYLRWWGNFKGRYPWWRKPASNDSTAQGVAAPSADERVKHAPVQPASESSEAEPGVGVKTPATEAPKATRYRLPRYHWAEKPTRRQEKGKAPESDASNAV